MCGIFGVITRPGRFAMADLKKSLDLINHRGPDGEGLDCVYRDSNWEIWFGHKRLSILDLTELGRQPMKFKRENLDHSIVFNGEVYNHLDLRREYLSDFNFISRSDTETLLAGLIHFKENFISKLNGMFAFSYFNQREKKIILSRDRFGKKPLYVYRTDSLMIFSSELKPILNLVPDLQVDPEAIALYRWLGYIPAHLSIYKGVEKFKASEFQTIELEYDRIKYNKSNIYYDPVGGYSKRFGGSFEEAKEELKFLIDDATRIRLEADVPVGIFLSGGIDSSLVAASVAKFKKDSVKAFTVGFDDPSFDESPVAIEIARDLGIEIEVLKLKKDDYLRQINKIPFHYDEPFSDSSQIPTMAISEAASKQVKVVLTGDGGDEVFVGYSRYFALNRLKNLIKVLNAMPAFKSTLAKALDIHAARGLLKAMFRINGISDSNFDHKLSRLKQIFMSSDVESSYDQLVATFQKEVSLSPLDSSFLPDNLYLSVINWQSEFNWNSLKSRSLEERLASIDLVSYMRDDVLVKVDRASMAYGLEARSPLLDFRVVDFGLSLPKEFKVKNGYGKWILRDILSDRFSKKIASLPKRGFGVPLPDSLPAAPNLVCSWNKFVEQKWFEVYG
jgi:asparagine synthase (glutamine-hydrolysing)